MDDFCGLLRSEFLRAILCLHQIQVLLVSRHVQKFVSDKVRDCTNAYQLNGLVLRDATNSESLSNFVDYWTQFVAIDNYQVL